MGHLQNAWALFVHLSLQLGFGRPPAHWREAWVHPHFTKQNWPMSVSSQGWVRMVREENPNHRNGNSVVWKCALTRKDCPGLEPPLGEEITEPVTWRSDELKRTPAPSSAGFMVVEPHQLLCLLFPSFTVRENASVCPVCQFVLTTPWGFVLYVL